MDNDLLSERLAASEEFVQDYRAVRALGAEMRHYAIRMHANRLGFLTGGGDWLARIDKYVAPLVDNTKIQFPNPGANMTIGAKTQEIAMSDKNFVQTKTLVGGVDFATMNDQAVYDKIAALEARVEQLDKIKTKPASLKAEIDQINANIAALVKLADDRHAKKSAKADDAAAA